ncbi:MAG: hypothetical protein Q9164_005186 [Protoblastenia rupestris]
MAESAKTGLLDLEKELTCSICTEILYQPLTLLDCLHTFCGSCLKEWFSWQAHQASSSKPNPFTCPSCRASVRETRPNATVTTLLEMYLQANPARARSELEKAETRKAYTPGEDVLPKIRRKKESKSEVEDRRMVEEARELSLREVGIRGPASYQRGTRHRARDGERESSGASAAQTGITADFAAQARQIEHQSSLRSLLSSSDLDSSEMEEEILRQIMEEGILDGIDLNNIDGSQEDELSEKIAEAYRRRHNQRSGLRDIPATQRRSHSQEHDPAAEQRRQRRSARISNSSHPPVSRPHLLEAYPTVQGHRRRTSSEHRRQTSPNTSSHSRTSSDTQRQAVRSATDLSNQPHSSEATTSNSREASYRPRRAADVNEGQPEIRFRGRTSQEPSFRYTNDRFCIPSNTAAHPSTVGPNSTSPNLGDRPQNPSTSSQQSTVDNGGAISDIASAPSAPTTQPSIYLEPSISCEQCGRANLQYDPYWNCSKCKGGKYNICQRCYRTGKGCLHWYGFGYAATQRYERQAPPTGSPPNHELPHRLIGHRYIRPPPESLRSEPKDTPPIRHTTSDPAKRLQSGPYCSSCSLFSPNCYWKCDSCNEGEWGFCNSCVNQGKCCTHALLPVGLRSYLNDHKRSPPATPTSTSFTPAHASPVSSIHTTPEAYTALTISTHCDNCTYPIPPSTTRFHCPICNNGDFDLCTTCYLKLIKRGTISADNGPKGWRRCPNGHRMIVVGFEDSALGQRRIVVKDLVGGHALKEGEEEEEEERDPAQSIEWSWRDGERRQVKSIARNINGSSSASTSTTNLPSDATPPPLLKTYPPNGGVGMRVLALWSYWPEEGVVDELAFPKGAEIGEGEDINGDWFWGVYCGRKGLFPGAYGRVVGRVGM